MSAAVNIRGLSVETARRFKAQAAKEGMTQAEWLTELVRRVEEKGA